MIINDDDERKAARRKQRIERAMQRAQERAAARERAKIPVPHVGLAAYFPLPPGRDAGVAQRLAELLVDSRWPWLPCWTSRSGIDKRDDTTSVRSGGKNGARPVLDLLLSDKTSMLHMNRAMGDDNFTTVMLDVDPRESRRGDNYELLVTCRTVDLPAGKSFEAWLTLAHELVATVGATHATLGAWPTYNMAIQDTWRTRMILDTPRGDFDLGLPEAFRAQLDALGSNLRQSGRAYARHPRWGTYLHAEHLAAIGGVDRVRAEVAPARIEPVGALTYLQLTDSIDTALTPEAGAKRRALEALMAPILVGAPLPPPPAPTV